MSKATPIVSKETLVKVTTLAGLGVEGDPTRKVDDYFLEDGTHLVRVDDYQRGAVKMGPLWVNSGGKLFAAIQALERAALEETGQEDMKAFIIADRRFFEALERERPPMFKIVGPRNGDVIRVGGVLVRLDDPGA